MALDLGDTSLQIERMISELKSRAKDRMDRLEITLKEMYSFDVDFYQKKFNLSKIISALNDSKWEAIIPIMILFGIFVR